MQSYFGHPTIKTTRVNGGLSFTSKLSLPSQLVHTLNTAASIPRGKAVSLPPTTKHKGKPTSNSEGPAPQQGLRNAIEATDGPGAGAGA